MSQSGKKKKPLIPPLVVGVGIGFFLAMVLVVIANYNQLGSSGPALVSRVPLTAPPPPPKARPSVSPAVFRVASQFVCTCGACGEKPLESCDCPTAVEGRGFIQQQLASGRSEAEAADALEAKNGGRKRAGVGVPQSNDQPTAAQPDQRSTGAGHLAMAADREHIISHFKCPCKQCSIDELSDCECPHPNGAQEVKKFIDAAIALQKHTVGEIIALVEERYGGRIR